MKSKRKNYDWNTSDVCITKIDYRESHDGRSGWYEGVHGTKHGFVQVYAEWQLIPVSENRVKVSSYAYFKIILYGKLYTKVFNDEKHNIDVQDWTIHGIKIRATKWAKALAAELLRGS